MKVAVVQLNSREDKEANVRAAEELIDRAAADGAKFVALPEYFTWLGRDEGFLASAETIPGPTIERLRARARKHRVYLHCGSMAEKSDQASKPFNTSVVIDPKGEIIGKYRKIHLYDVDLGPGLVYRESDVIEPGGDIVTVEAGELKLGLSICYDLRFPEIFRILAVRGAEVLMVPAAFTAATGKDVWEVLLRARAIENQAFVIAPAQIGEHPEGKFCYGRSMIVDPTGLVLARAPDDVTLITADIDLSRVSRFRREVPSLANRRPSAYSWDG